MSFEVSFTWELEDGIAVPIRVTGHQQPIIPANFYGEPESWSPQEGGELEDMKVFSGNRLSRDVEDKLLGDERFIEMVEAGL